MNSRKAYWFEQPYLQGVKNIAVCPIVDPRDGRMYFSVPGSGIWGLYGTLIKDTRIILSFDAMIPTWETAEGLINCMPLI